MLNLKDLMLLEQDTDSEGDDVDIPSEEDVGDGEGTQPVAPSETAQPQNISLDQKVDRYLVQYEREASPIQPIQEKHNGLDRFIGFLFEQEPTPDIPPPPDMGLPGDDMGGGPPPSMGVEKPSIPVPMINIKTFAYRLARLVNNHEALIDPKTTILNRAQAYIAKNYNENTAKELMIILDTNYSLTPRSPEDRSDVPETPLALGAAAGDLAGGGAAGAPGP